VVAKLEETMTPTEAVEIYLNGNYLEFKEWLQTSSKTDVIEAFYDVIFITVAPEERTTHLSTIFDVFRHYLEGK
jgi:hypothetical protein